MRIINVFINVIRNELKAFVFWSLLFSLFRLTFILAFSEQAAVGTGDILKTLYLGSRISLKTIGIICLLSGVVSFVINFLIKKVAIEKLQLWWHSISIVFFSFCFCARFPYYKQFNNAFDIMIINGLKDDKKAIWDTAVTQYQLWPRVAGWIVLAVLLIFIFKQYQKWIIIKADKAEKQYSPSKNLARLLLHVVLLAVIGIFCRYGGAFDYAHCVNWENAARLKSHLLNEAIIDDGQALYRVVSMHKRLKNVAKVEFSAEELAEKLTVIGGKANDHSINKALLRKNTQPLLKHQPKQMALVVGESFGVWPFLPEFADLHLVDNTTALMTSPKAVSVKTMLAHGNGTISSLNGLLTGLPDTGIYQNYDKRMLAEPQSTGIGYYMKQLGYKTVFWYGGFSDWQNIKNIVLAQSFDEFHCADEFSYTGGNAWGCADRTLFTEISKYMEAHKNDKVFHMILTVTNHPPYTLDVVKDGFPATEISQKLPASIGKGKDTLMELGHMWYADKTVGEFVHEAEKILPDTLFILTGDHSERFNFAKEQPSFVRAGIPCVFYGQAIDKNVLDDIKIGVHGEIAPTLMHMFAPAGMEYSSFYDSMFSKKEYVTNFEYVAFKNASTSEQRLVPHNKVSKNIQKQIEAARDVAAWRIVKGDKF